MNFEIKRIKELRVSLLLSRRRVITSAVHKTRLPRKEIIKQFFLSFLINENADCRTWRGWDKTGCPIHCAAML